MNHYNIVGQGEHMAEITHFLEEAWRMLTESFAIKALLAVVAEVGIYMLGLKHVQVLGIFIILVFLDLITKLYPL